MAVALYPGSFDPVTLGHVDVATRASNIFDKVIVAVYDTPSKRLLFNTEERVELFRDAIHHIPNVEVKSFSGLVVEAARRLGAKAIVKGLRRGSDFEYEFEMAFMNKKLAPDIETVCLMASLQYHYVSSSLLKEVIGLEGDVSNLLPNHVIEAVRARLESRA